MMEDLERMQSVNIMDLKREELAKVEDIVIDTSKDVKSRTKSFVEQTGNPFALNIGEYIVQFAYAEDAENTIDDCMIRLAQKKAQIMI